MLINLINIILLIPKIKMIDLAVFLSNGSEVSSCCNFFNELILFFDWDKIFELINNSLNLVLLYCKLIDKLKI